jgi:hypothetical protein
LLGQNHYVKTIFDAEYFPFFLHQKFFLRNDFDLTIFDAEKRIFDAEYFPFSLHQKFFSQNHYRKRISDAEKMKNILHQKLFT